MKLIKAGKIISGIVGGFLLIILLIALFWLGPTVKLIAQQIGSKALGTELTINSLSINPRKGIIHLTEFAIGNPDIFGRSNAVSLASLDVAIDMGSIFTKTVVVHQVELNSPHFIYEQSAASDNIQEFILSIQEFIGLDPNAPPPPTNSKKQEKSSKKKTVENKEPKVVIVESLVINDTQFHMANTDDHLLDFSIGFEQLSVSMTNGNVQLDNFYISNPGRLETTNLFSLEQVEILLHPGSIYSSNVTIHAVNILKPHVFVEHNPETDTAWEFLKIASILASKISTNAPKNAVTNQVVREEPQEPESTPKEVILETLTIDDVQLHVINIGDPMLSVHLGLQQLAVALDKGDISLNNLFFTNPTRLKTPNLFALESISIHLEPDSLKTDTLIIRDVQVKKPHVILELNNEANTVGEFIKIANGFTERAPVYPIPVIPSKPTNAVTTATLDPQPEPPAPPLELHNLLVDDIQIKLLDSTPTNNTPTEAQMLAGIGEISIRLVEGKLQIEGVTIPNLPGHLATNLFQLANIDISIDPASLFSDQVVIQEVFINSPTFNLEQTEKSGNVAELQHVLAKMTPPPSGRTNTVPPVKTATEPNNPPIPLADQPVILHQLIITNMAVNLNLPVSTNTGAMASMTDLSKLNPMGKLDKLNPLSSSSTAEEITDPNAPLPLIAFDRLTIEPLKGLLYINGLRVANPPGFSRRDLVNIEEFRIDLDPDSIPSNALLIEDILITRPRIRYERQIVSDNVKALQKEIEQATTRRKEYMDVEKPKPEETADQSAVTPESESRKVIIAHVLISSGMVSAKLSALPALPVPLPNIELKDIGKEKGGATLTEASTQVFDTFYESMIGAVGNATGFAGDALKGVGSFGKDALGGVTDGIGNAIGGTEKAVKDAVEKTKNRRSNRRAAGGRRSAIK